MRFSEARTEGYRAFANKIWNAARFLFMNVDRATEAGYMVSMLEAGGAIGALPEADAAGDAVDRVAAAGRRAAEVDRALGEYRFDEAANAVYQFFWGEFCDWYLEMVKLRLEFGEGAEQNAATAATLTTLVARV